MILRGALKAAAAIAAVSTAVGASVVAAAFALYALLEPSLGAPGAAALVALVLALIAIVVALLATRGGGRGRRAEPSADVGLGERLMDLARAKPLLSTGAAVAAGLIALRNPALVSLIMTAVLKKPPSDRR